MKLLPLNTKKNIHRFMSRFRGGTAALLIVGATFAGIGGLIGWEITGAGGPGRDKEKTSLQEKVDRLLETNRTMRSFNAVTNVLAAGRDFALDPVKVQAKQAELKAAFNAEEEATGIALAHAQTLSPHERTNLYTQLSSLKPLPDYLRAPGEDEDFMTLEPLRKQVMSRPGFTPTLATAREIIAGPRYGGKLLLTGLLGAPIFAIISVFGFAATRKRLGKSIHKDEVELKRAEEAARQAAEAQQAQQAQQAALSPNVTTVLDRDIRVRQIKLAGREPPRRGGQSI